MRSSAKFINYCNDFHFIPKNCSIVCFDAQVVAQHCMLYASGWATDLP